jgi:hypothetical protein
VPWLDDPDTFVKGCGPGCSHDSAAQSELFAFEEGSKKPKCGNCTNSACFFARRAKYNVKHLKELDAGENLPVVTTEWNAVEVGKVKATRIDDYELYSSKASKKDLASAKKVILVKSDGSPSIAYLKPKSKGSGTGNLKLATPKEKAENRTKVLQSRRWKIVHEKLITTLQNSVHTDCTMDIDKLVGVFGLPWKRSFWERRNLRWWKLLDEGKYLLWPAGSGDKTTTSREEALWAGLKEVLLDQTRGFRLATEILDVVPDMERLARLVKFPLEEEKRLADLAVPPPKSWGPTDPHTLQPLAGNGTAQTASPAKTAVKKNPAKKSVAKTAKKLASKKAKQAVG